MRNLVTESEPSNYLENTQFSAEFESTKPRSEDADQSMLYILVKRTYQVKVHQYITWYIETPAVTQAIYEIFMRGCVNVSIEFFRERTDNENRAIVYSWRIKQLFNTVRSRNLLFDLLNR